MKRKNWNENLYTASWRKSTWPNYSERVTYPDHEPTTKPAPQPRKTKSIQQILQETAKQWNKENPHSQIQVNRKLKPRPRKEPELSRQIFWKEQDIKFHKQTYERTHKKPHTRRTNEETTNHSSPGARTKTTTNPIRQRTKG